MGERSGAKGIYRRGDVWWFRTDPITGRRASSGKRSLRAAEAEHRRRELLAAEDPAHAAAREELLGDWMSRTVAAKQAAGRAEATTKALQTQLGHWVRVLGEQALMADITPRVVLDFIAQRRSEGVTDHTIYKEIGAIKQVAKMARHAGCFPTDPELLRPPDFVTGYDPRKRMMPPEEAAALISALKPHRAAVVAFILATGARLSETMKATAADIDWVAGFVHIRGTKTRKADRHIPIFAHVRPLLEQAEGALPFARWGKLHRDLAVACKRAGVEVVTPNDLRRSAGSWLIELGVSLELVARYLGHSSTAMVERVYGRPRDTAIRDLMERQIASGKPLSAGSEQRDVTVQSATPQDDTKRT